MARRKRRSESLVTQDPEGLTAWMQRYLEALEVRRFSPNTVRTRLDSLRIFFDWCTERSLTKPTELTRPQLLAYQRHLFYYRRSDGRPLSATTQRVRISAVKRFFTWLTRENVILSNPASELELPRMGHPLPKHVLTPEEAEAILSRPDLETLLGLRDRAILEVFYSTGIRRTELVDLGVFDIDSQRQTVRVREGKGGKDRIVPVGERALAWCQKYLDEVRPELVGVRDQAFFFLSKTGERLSPNGLTKLVRDYVSAADLGKTGACHLFRHAMATAMLENGADIRFIQEMLGHSKLSTTEIYTRVSIQKLQEIHRATHPSARLPDRPGTAGEASAALQEPDER